MGTDRVELMLFPEYSTLVSAERNLEEYPLFELKARQRGSKARLFERVIEGEGGVSLRQSWKVIPSGEYGMPGPVAGRFPHYSAQTSRKRAPQAP